MKTIAYAISGLEENLFQVMWANLPTATVILFSIIATIIAMVKIMKGFGRFEKVEVAVGNLSADMSQVKGHLNSVEGRLAVVETKLEVVINKVDKLEEKVDRLEEKMDKRFDKMDEKFDQKFDTIISILLSKKDESSPSPIRKSH